MVRLRFDDSANDGHRRYKAGEVAGVTDYEFARRVVSLGHGTVVSDKDEPLELEATLVALRIRVKEGEPIPDDARKIVRGLAAREQRLAKAAKKVKEE